MLENYTLYTLYRTKLLSNIWAQDKDDGWVAEHRVEIGVEEMGELVDGESTVHQVISEEVVRCRLACVHHRLPPEAWAWRKSHDHRQVAGVEGHVDLTFGFILLRWEIHERSVAFWKHLFDLLDGRNNFWNKCGDAWCVISAPWRRQRIGSPPTSQAFQADDHANATVLKLGSPQVQEIHIPCSAHQEKCIGNMSGVENKKKSEASSLFPHRTFSGKY